MPAGIGGLWTFVLSGLIRSVYLNNKSLVRRLQLDPSLVEHDLIFIRDIFLVMTNA